MGSTMKYIWLAILTGLMLGKVQAEDQLKVFIPKASVPCGLFVYRVDSVEWSQSLTDNPILNKDAAGTYLILRLTIKNIGTESAVIPGLYLIDDVGNRYNDSAHSMVLKDGLAPLSSINPGIQINGSLAFDVPKRSQFDLTVRGGLLSNEKATIQLTNLNGLEIKFPRSIERTQSDAAKSREERRQIAIENSQRMLHEMENFKGPKTKFVPGQTKSVATIEPAKDEEEKRFRTWTSSDGTFKIEAKFIQLLMGKVTIEKRDGKRIVVEKEKLSIPDREYIERPRGN
jgi:SLA1 homology domain 1, SHD1/Domain of unknown function (DUF4352)